MTRLSDALTRANRVRGWTAIDLSRASGLSQSTVLTVLSGTSRHPTRPTRDALDAVLAPGLAGVTLAIIEGRLDDYPMPDEVAELVALLEQLPAPVRAAMVEMARRILSALTGPTR